MPLVTRRRKTGKWIGLNLRFWRATSTPFALALVLLALWVQPLHAQSPSITAEVDRTNLSIGESLNLTVTISGSSSTPAPSLPDLDGFDMVSRSTASSISIVNGVMSTKVSFQYRLQPTREGTLTIEPISVTLDGRKYSTEPIQVDVTAGSSSSQPQAPLQPTQPGPQPSKLSGQDFFIDAEVDNKTPYLGQQMTYIFRYYQAATTFGQPRYEAPEFTGFWNKQESDQRQYSVTAANRRYVVVELRTVLFPTVVGPVTIEPGRLTIPGSLFQRDRSLSTQPVTLEVVPLPANAPPDFSGAIGQFSISSTLNTNSARVNEPLTLTVTLSGEGNIDTMPSPVWPELPGWRSFESAATTNTQVNDNRLGGNRIYERLLVPGDAGDFVIPAITYTFFDPEATEYRSVATEPIHVTVAPGADQPPVPPIPGDSKTTVERLATDIRHIKPVPPMLHSAGSELTDRTVYWAAWALPPLLFATALLWQRRRERLESNIGLMRSRQAHRNAARMLSEALASGSDPFSASGEILTTYVSDKLNQPVAGLTQDALGHQLALRGIESTLVDRVKATLIASERGRYAPADAPTSSEHEVLEETKTLISDLEKAIGS